MTRQIIETPRGEKLVVLPEAEYLALIDAAEDAADAAIVDRFERRLASGEEELIPSGYVYRMLDGENKVAVWRDYRGISAKELAQKTGITQAYLSQIETGKRDGTIGTMKKIAGALGVGLDDIV